MTFRRLSEARSANTQAARKWSRTRVANKQKLTRTVSDPQLHVAKAAHFDQEVVVRRRHGLAGLFSEE